MKRILDLLVGGLGLVLLSPLLAAIAALVRISSPGPILFRQVRVGRYGQHFEILKFRSMCHVSSSQGPLLTVAGDQRITSIGRWLRATKLDELPQLWNVVRGDMSLVGPRPEVPKYVALYPPAVAARVLSVRPGMTDEASVLFRNESEILSMSTDPERTYVDEILPIKLELYTRYVSSQSIWRDVTVLSRTLWSVVAGRRDSGSFVAVDDKD